MTHAIQYTADLTALTIIRTNEHGEDFDLNADGMPCTNLGDLHSFIVELFEQSYFSGLTRDMLIEQVQDAQVAAGQPLF